MEQRNGSENFELEVLEESAIDPELDAAIRRLLATCFPADAGAFGANRCWHDVAPEWTVLCPIGERPVGHVGVVVREMSVGGEPVTIAGIQSLAVTLEARRTGLSTALMNRAMDEARARGIAYGLLFCVPGLEGFYERLGWRRIDRPVTLRDSAGDSAPLPEKNIAMVLELAGEPFPPGPVDLQGRDW